jgi:integrase
VGAKDKRTGKHHKSFVFRKFTKYQNYVIKIGSYPEMSVDEARQKAQQLNLNVISGLIVKDTSLDELKEFKGSISKQFASRKTLGALLEAYADDLDHRGKLSGTQVRTSVRTNVKDRFPELWNKPASDISSDDIFEILSHPTLKKAKSNSNLVRGYLHSAFEKGKKAKYELDGAESLKGFELELNPVSNIPKRETASKIADDYNLDEKQLKHFAKLIDTLPDKRWQTIAKVILLLGGQRPTHLIRVTKQDTKLDKDDGWLRLVQKKGPNNPSGKPHDIPLTPKLIKLIKSLNPFQSGYLFETMFRRRELGKPETYEMGPILETDTLNENIFVPIAKQMMADGSWTLEKPFTINVLRKSGVSYLTSKGIERRTCNFFHNHNLTGVDYKNYLKYDFKKEKLDCLKLLEKLLP